MRSWLFLECSLQVLLLEGFYTVNNFFWSFWICTLAGSNPSDNYVSQVQFKYNIYIIWYNIWLISLLVIAQIIQSACIVFGSFFLMSSMWCLQSKLLSLVIPRNSVEYLAELKILYCHRAA